MIKKIFTIFETRHSKSKRFMLFVFLIIYSTNIFALAPETIFSKEAKIRKILHDMDSETENVSGRVNILEQQIDDTQKDISTAYSTIIPKEQKVTLRIVHTDSNYDDAKRSLYEVQFLINRLKADYIYQQDAGTGFDFEIPDTGKFSRLNDSFFPYSYIYSGLIMRHVVLTGGQYGHCHWHSFRGIIIQVIHTYIFGRNKNNVYVYLPIEYIFDSVSSYDSGETFLDYYS